MLAGGELQDLVFGALGLSSSQLQLRLQRQVFGLIIPLFDALTLILQRHLAISIAPSNRRPRQFPPLET